MRREEEKTDEEMKRKSVGTERKKIRLKSKVCSRHGEKWTKCNIFCSTRRHKGNPVLGIGLCSSDPSPLFLSVASHIFITLRSPQMNKKDERLPNQGCFVVMQRLCSLFVFYICDACKFVPVMHVHCVNALSRTSHPSCISGATEGSKKRKIENHVVPYSISPLSPCVSTK